MSMASAAPGPGAPAGFLLRLVASIIDGLIIGIPTYVLNIILVGVTSDPIMATVISYVVGGVAGVLYWAKLESGPGQATLGKKVMKIKVTSTSGGTLDFATAVKRSAVHWITTFTAIVDVLLMLPFILTLIALVLVLVSCIAVAFKANKQGLHDDFSKAQVVRA